MKFLIISDAHGNVENVEKLSDVAKNVDAVLFGGDFAKFGEVQTGKGVLDAIVRLHDTVFAVRGNCDEENFIDEMKAADIEIEGSISFHEGLAFAGTGGGTKFSLDTPFERDEDDIVSDLSIVRSSNLANETKDGENLPLVLIMHNPPKNTECDKIPNGVHVGSEKLRNFIEEFRPILVVTGHIHESAGVSTIGKSTVVNPGSLAEGKYALAEISKNGDEWKVDSVSLLSL